MIKNSSKEQSPLVCEQMTAASSSRKTMSSRYGFLCLVNSLKLISIVICYYFLSITLTFYNKIFVKHFHLPLSLTLFHLIFKFVLSWIVRIVWEWKTQIRRVEISWSTYVKRLAPPGIVSALDIGLSNWSFEYITISLYTMCKSSTVLYILGFSLLFRLEKFRPSLLVVVVFISGGLFLFTYHSTEFNLIGFMLVMTATFLSGLRWTLTQLVAQKEALGLSHPLDMMYHIEPWMIIGLLPLSVLFEGLRIVSMKQFFRYESVGIIMKNTGLAVIGATLAFFMEIAEFILISNTSSLTLSIAGIFKEIIVLFLAAEINGDHVSTLNVVGFIVCLCGMVFHIFLKTVERNNNAKKCQEINEEITEMLNSHGDANRISDEETYFSNPT